MPQNYVQHDKKPKVASHKLGKINISKNYNKKAKGTSCPLSFPWGAF